MKKILVFPGTFWQIPLVKKIKEMGHYAIVVNPYKNSPAFEYADDYIESDIFDFDRIINYSENKKIDAVISDECDIAMPMVARIGEHLKLNTIDGNVARIFTDKYCMREFCKKNGISIPEYALCKSVDDAIKFFKKLNKPIIIKPIDSNASHGVFKVSSEYEINQKFNESMSFSRVEKYVLAERYIDGTEFTIDGIKTPTNHFTLAISQKKHYSHNNNIASELKFTHTNPNFDYDSLKEENDKFVKNSGLDFGFTHAEYKYENGRFYLIEIAARGGGNMISALITQYMSGYDTYKYLINCSLGNITEENFDIKDECKNRAAILKFFQTPFGGGKVKAFYGIDILENEPDIKLFMFNFKIGDIIEDCVSDSARIGFYIVCSDSLQKLESIVDKVENNFSIELEK